MFFWSQIFSSNAAWVQTAYLHSKNMIQTPTFSFVWASFLSRLSIVFIFFCCRTIFVNLLQVLYPWPVYGKLLSLFKIPVVFNKNTFQCSCLTSSGTPPPTFHTASVFAQCKQGCVAYASERGGWWRVCYRPVSPLFYSFCAFCLQPFPLTHSASTDNTLVAWSGLLSGSALLRTLTQASLVSESGLLQRACYHAGQTTGIIIIVVQR